MTEYSDYYLRQADLYSDFINDAALLEAVDDYRRRQSDGTRELVELVEQAAKQESEN